MDEVAAVVNPQSTDRGRCAVCGVPQRRRAVQATGWERAEHGRSDRWTDNGQTDRQTDEQTDRRRQAGTTKEAPSDRPGQGLFDHDQSAGR